MLVRSARGANTISTQVVCYLSFPILMLCAYCANLFLLSRRGNLRSTEDKCPVDIPSLCKLHNVISCARLQLQAVIEKEPNKKHDLSADPEYMKLAPIWNTFQKKHANRSDIMRKSHRIDPIVEGAEMVNLPASSALIGIQKDMTLAKTTKERCTALSCSLRPEFRNQPIVPFVDLYDARYRTYNGQNLARMSVEKLANFQSEF